MSSHIRTDVRRKMINYSVKDNVCGFIIAISESDFSCLFGIVDV